MADVDDWQPVQRTPQATAPSAPASNEPEANPTAVLQNFAQPARSAWDDLKEDFTKAITPLHDVSTAWEGAKAQWDQTMATGKTAMDIFNLAMSPAQGIWHAGAAVPGGYGIAHLFGPEPGQTQAEATNKAVNYLDMAALAIAPAKGAALAGAAAEGGITSLEAELNAFRNGVLKPSAANPDLLGAKGSPLEVATPDAQIALGLDDTQARALAMNSSSPSAVTLHAAKDLGVLGPEVELPATATDAEVADARIRTPSTSAIQDINGMFPRPGNTYVGAPYLDEVSAKDLSGSIADYLEAFGEKAGFHFRVGPAEEIPNSEGGPLASNKNYVYIPDTPEELNQRWYGVSRSQIIYHEVGHALDMSFNSNGNSTKVLAEGPLKDEMIASSKIFRPRTWSQIPQYASKPAELMADNIARWLSDPSAHKDMPLFTAKYGKRLAPYKAIADRALPVPPPEIAVSGGAGGAGGAGGGEIGPPGEPPHFTENEMTVPLSDGGNLRIPEILGLSDLQQQGLYAGVERHGGYIPARHGLMSQSSMEAIAEAFGVKTTDLNRVGISRVLNNDVVTKVAYEGLITSSRNFADAAEAVRNARDDVPLKIKLQEVLMRREILMDAFAEHISGLKAMWGRQGNVLNSYLDTVKDAETFKQFMLDHGQGRSLDDMDKIADAAQGLEPRKELPKLMRNVRQPDFWDKLMEYRRNSLLTGPMTHLTYALDTIPWAMTDAASSVFSGGIGKVRTMASSADMDRMYSGEWAGNLYGFVSSFPTALRMGVEIAQSGKRVVLPGGRPSLVNPYIGAKEGAIGGTLGKIINTPTRIASGIHGAQSWLGYNQSLAAISYRAARAQGLSVTDPAFLNAVHNGIEHPTDGWMDEARQAADRMAMTGHLSRQSDAVISAIKSTKVGELVFPFMHMPLTLLKAANSMTPMAALYPETRADLLMQNGGVAFDRAWGRLTTGAALMGYVSWQTGKDNMTGGGPQDPYERALWMEKHRPYSIRLAGQWVDYSRLGPIGSVLGLGADLHDLAVNMTYGNYEKAAATVMVAAGHYLQDGLGLLNLKELMDAGSSVEKAAVYAGRQVGTFLPLSTFTSQVAGATDPYLRQVRTFMEALVYHFPGARQTLLPSRDWMGNPLPNDKEGFGALLASRNANPDPITAELNRLGKSPAPVAESISGVPLTRDQADLFQTWAGINTRQRLTARLNDPRYKAAQPRDQSAYIDAEVRAAREEAALNMRFQYPSLITRALAARVSGIKERASDVRP